LKSKPNDLRDPSGTYSKPRTQGKTPNQTSSYLREGTHRNLDSASPPIKPLKKEKKFADNYLLFDHVKRRLDQNRYNEAVEDVRRSSQGNKDPAVWNLLMLEQSKQGKFGQTKKIFNEMRKRGATPDSRSWTHLLEALLHSTSPRKSQEAESILQSMKVKNVVPSSYTVNAYIKTLIKDRNWFALAQFEMQVQNQETKANVLPIDSVTYTLLLNAYALGIKNDSTLLPIGVELLSLCFRRIVDGSVTLDPELLSSICKLSMSINTKNSLQVPWRVLQSIYPQESLWQKFPDSSSLSNSCKEHSTQKNAFQFSSTAANWFLMAINSYDKLLHSERSVCTTNLVSSPLLTEYAYQWLNHRVKLDMYALEILFSTMSQIGRSPPLVDRYFEIWHQKPRVKPSEIQAVTPAFPVPLPLSMSALTSLCYALRDKYSLPDFQCDLSQVKLILEEFEDRMASEPYLPTSAIRALLSLLRSVLKNQGKTSNSLTGTAEEQIGVVFQVYSILNLKGHSTSVAIQAALERLFSSTTRSIPHSQRVAIEKDLMAINSRASKLTLDSEALSQLELIGQELSRFNL
jgi:pentatricopeptide repeat protein